MPVVPYKPDLFEKCKEIYQFLSSCQQQARQAQHSKIAHISLPLPPIAPWAILEALSTPEQIYFYYDHAIQQRSVVALDIAVAQQAQGGSRFARIQQFIDVWRKRIFYSEASLTLETTPYFFSTFTFFETPPSEDGHFAAAYVFVPRLQITTDQDQVTVSFNCLIDDSLNIARLIDEISQQLRQLFTLADKSEQTSPFVRPPRQQISRTIIRDTGKFKQAVIASLQPIQEHRLRKVVLADAVEVLATAPIKVSASLAALRQTYPECYIFASGNGQGQAFIGASPERLLSIQQTQFITDALAGSAPRGCTPAEDRVLAQQLLANPKERHEHQFVVEFIVRQLRALGLNPEYVHSPGLLKLSNIQHLHTLIQATLPSGIEPLRLLERLHPTPAVAGLPRAAACELIRQSESFQRELYAAPLGWVTANGNSEFLVGIRSALINGRQARLYAGAGIVAGSNPDKELAEIKLKFQALLGSLM